jgi:hypothetical protein
LFWHSGEIYRAWEQIHHALREAIKPLPRQALVFLANRASDEIIRSQAAEVLDWRDNCRALPWSWGWSLSGNKERHRGSCDWVCAVSRA